jgi:putative nucleotidyltransferase with HDIG domain
VDLIVDDTPGAIILSGFDPYRREIARRVIERLIADGRIHPARIEEVVEKVRAEMEDAVRKDGEEAAFELGLHDLHPEVLRLMGRLQFRTSYGQNVLKHTLEVVYLAGVMAREVGLDTTVAVRAAFLHDIGKIQELAYNRSFSYTTRGQLLGHMIIELEMLQAKIEKLPAFPPELKTLLEHLIISHHGHYEFGSPKLPMFPEALMLHYLDDLDSKMEAMRAQLERDLGMEGAWTTFNPSLGRPLLNSAKFLQGENGVGTPNADVSSQTSEQNASGVSEKTAAVAAGQTSEAQGTEAQPQNLFPAEQSSQK